MKGKKLILTIILITVVMLWLGSKNSNQTGLVTPQMEKVSTSVPPQAPKTFQFDRSTDLKKELDSINPQVLDSDFNE